MGKKILKKLLPKAKKKITAPKPKPKAPIMREEQPVVKKIKASNKILTAEGWKRRIRKPISKKG